MGTVIRSVLTGLLRYVLFAVSAWAVNKGIATQEEVELLISGLAGLLLVFGSLVWVKYRDRVKLLTALQLPRGSSERDVDHEIAAGGGVKPGTGAGVVLLAAAIGSGVLLSGCGDRRVQLPSLPDQVPGIEAHITTVGGNLQQLLGLSSNLINTVSKIEDEAARNGAIPAELDAQFDAAMVAYANASDAASRGLNAGIVSSWPQLRALVEPVLKRGQELLGIAYDMGAIRGRVTTFLRSLRDVFMEMVGQFVVGRNFGGA